MRAAIYTRVGNPRSDESHTLQATRCVMLLRERGFQAVDARYVDTGMSRGEFLRMLDDLRAGDFDVVLVDRIGRLPRDMQAVERIVLAGGRLVGDDGYDSGVTSRQRHDAEVQRLADEAPDLRLV